MTTRAKQISDIFIKLALLSLALYFIWQKAGLQAYRDIFSQQWHGGQILLPAFLLLAALNLWLDGRIWQRVHHFIGSLSMKRALKTNFVSYAFSFITPANSGEVAARYVMLKGHKDRGKTLFLTFWSHFPRLITKLLLGGSALLLLLGQGKAFSLTSQIMLLAAWNAGILGFYLFFIRIQRWLSTMGWRSLKMENYILKNRPQMGEKIHLLALAVFKYLVYNSQFIALILMWGGLQWHPDLLLAVLAFFFISAMVPTFPAADFLVKGAIAIYIFKDVLPDERLLLHSTLAIWMINIALPALAGLVVVMRSNIPRALKERVPLGSRYGL